MIKPQIGDKFSNLVPIEVMPTRRHNAPVEVASEWECATANPVDDVLLTCAAAGACAVVSLHDLYTLFVPHAKQRKYTVFCRDLADSSTSTMFIEHIEAESPEQAAVLGRALCADAWEYARDDVAVVGVAVGAVEIALWEDAGLSLLPEEVEEA